MNKKGITLLVAAVLVVAGLLVWVPHGWAILLALVVVYAGAAAYLTWVQSRLLREDLREISEGRVWSVDVDLQCQACKTTHKYPFALDTTHYTCQECGESNKIYMSLTSVAEFKPLDMENSYGETGSGS